MEIIKRGIVSRITDGFFSYHAWPSACTDENGVIYVVCSGMRMGHMCPFGKIVMYKSRDMGESFSLPTVIDDHFLDDRDPGILYLGGGKMIVTRCSHPAHAYENDYADWIHSDSGDAGTGLLAHFKLIPENERKGGCFYRILSDYGEKAQEEKRIAVHCPHGPIMLKNGSILYFGKEVFTGDPAREGRFSAYVSTDGGKSFEKAGECEIPEELGSGRLFEVHSAELEDGRIMALFRTHLTEDDNYFTMTKSFSPDGGKTWSPLEETGICGSPPHLCKTSRGIIVLTYGRRAEPYGIRGRLIDGNGNISDEEFILAGCDDEDIGYPATVELPDGTLFTVYYARCCGDSTASLMYVKWKI